MMEMPERVAMLPKDPKGRPVPWFVWWNEKTGEPDFRVIGPGKLVEAVMEHRCWICGQKLGRYQAFVIGPMCAINRISSEPPSHRECAIFAAQACPFLTTPKMHRNEKSLPPEYGQPAGQAILRNPGVALVWVTRDYKRIRLDNGTLFEVGTPLETLWFAEGRTATRAEIIESIQTGLPTLMEIANEDGPMALMELGKRTQEAMSLIPA
jgi:hypothetical protein